MRLSELITIYLAAAAPFGVIYFLRSLDNASTSRHALASVAAALGWPLTAALLFKSSRTLRRSGQDQGLSRDERRTELAKRALSNSLRRVEDLLLPAALPAEAARYSMFAAREALERYVGLTIAALDVDVNDAPSEREMEICRLAGRKDQDLITAGRCIHRGNVTRLLAHHRRARAKLVESLTDVRGTVANGSTPRSVSTPSEISEALISSLASAIELCSMLNDQRTVQEIAQLLDLECKRLRRLEAEADRRSREVESGSAAASLVFPASTAGLDAGL
jgi:hypothetical protein